ncbi:MAG TPA: hypothetical protein VG452_09995 [Egibacteraceae bacterium]|nr:hypothetical protein [Egibacteraceae bacterium]
MGVFSKRKDQEEPGGSGGSGLHIDLEERACPECRRALTPWQATCPHDGAPAVPRAQLPPAIAPPPAHLLADDEDP